MDKTLLLPDAVSAGGQIVRPLLPAPRRPEPGPVTPASARAGPLRGRSEAQKVLRCPGRQGPSAAGDLLLYLVDGVLLEHHPGVVEPYDVLGSSPIGSEALVSDLSIGDRHTARLKTAIGDRLHRAPNKKAQREQQPVEPLRLEDVEFPQPLLQSSGPNAVGNDAGGEADERGACAGTQYGYSLSRASFVTDTTTAITSAARHPRTIGTAVTTAATSAWHRVERQVKGNP